MANEVKNQEFNRAIKQLQVMMNDKQILNLAEQFFILKGEIFIQKVAQNAAKKIIRR